MKNIVISGNIGAGKTTLVKFLNKNLKNSIVMGEAVEDNPYLNKFYHEMNIWNDTKGSNKKSMSEIAVTMELFIHFHKLVQQFKIKTLENVDYIIQDRYLFDTLIFAQQLTKQNIMSLHDFNLFRDIYDNTFNITKPIDYLFYLKVSPNILMWRISERNRECEKDMSEEYIENLNKAYNLMFENKSSNVISQYTIDYNYISNEKKSEILDIILNNK